MVKRDSGENLERLHGEDRKRTKSRKYSTKGERARPRVEPGSTVRGTCSRLDLLLPPALIKFTTETDCVHTPLQQETHCVLHPNNPFLKPGSHCVPPPKVSHL